MMASIAPRRTRRKRVQKKIDRRFGLAHYDKQSIYIRKLSLAMEPLFEIGQDSTLSDLFKNLFLPHMKFSTKEAR